MPVGADGCPPFLESLQNPGTIRRAAARRYGNIPTIQIPFEAALRRVSANIILLFNAFGQVITCVIEYVACKKQAHIDYPGDFAELVVFYDDGGKLLIVINNLGDFG